MNIEEKLSQLTIEQLERFHNVLYYFNCTGIRCRECLFRTSDKKCLVLVVNDERQNRNITK